MAEQEVGDSSGDKGDGAKTAGSTIWDQDGGRRQAEEGHQQLTVNSAFFYSNDGVVVYTYLGWLQLAFDKLTGIFDRVGLRTNVRKTVGMVCQTFREYGIRADKAYTWRMTGEGRSFKE